MPPGWQGAAEGEPWTMEGFEALEAVERARRRVRTGLVLSPAFAWLWDYTIALSNRFEAGQVSPRPGADLIEFIWFYFSMGIEAGIGRTGLHVVFACLVAVAMGVALWGVAQGLRLDRLGVAARAMRHARGEQLRQLQGLAWLRGAPDATPGVAGRPRGRRLLAAGLLRPALAMTRFLPLLSFAATAFFAWRALAR